MLLAPPGNCSIGGGSAGLTQLTYGCLGCVLGAEASFSLQLHYSCQAVLLEAAAVPAYPLGSRSLAAADGAVTVGSASAGGRLAAVQWTLPTQLTLAIDNSTSTASASRRGYAFIGSALTVARASEGSLDATTSAASVTTLHPLAASVNLTILMPLSTTYTETLLTPRVPWTQLLANIVGLSGLLGGFGVLFGICESRLGVGKEAKMLKTANPLACVPPPAQRGLDAHPLPQMREVGTAELEGGAAVKAKVQAAAEQPQKKVEVATPIPHPLVALHSARARHSAAVFAHSQEAWCASSPDTLRALKEVFAARQRIKGWEADGGAASAEAPGREGQTTGEP